MVIMITITIIITIIITSITIIVAIIITIIIIIISSSSSSGSSIITVPGVFVVFGERRNRRDGSRVRAQSEGRCSPQSDVWTG